MEEKSNNENQENMQIHFKDFDIAFKTKTPNITKDIPFICEIFNAFLQEVYFASDKMKELDKMEGKLKVIKDKKEQKK